MSLDKFPAPTLLPLPQQTCRYGHVDGLLDCLGPLPPALCTRCGDDGALTVATPARGPHVEKSSVDYFLHNRKMIWCPQDSKEKKKSPDKKEINLK